MAFRLTICFRSLTLSDALRTSQTKIPAVATLVNPCRNLSLLSTISNTSRLAAITGNGGLSLRLQSQQEQTQQQQQQQQQQRQQQQRRLLSVLSRLDFYLDPIYFGSPLKKKRKIDPAVLKRREDRIRGKISRALGRLGKYADKLKPVDEYDVPRVLVKQRDARLRVLEPMSFEESEKRARLRREFNVYSHQLHIADCDQIRRVQASQRKALLELKAVSEELYLKAIAVDEEMLRLKSPIITLTPPIEDYEAPDGQHKDVTKTFEYEVDFLKVLEANKEKPKWALKKEQKAALAALEDDDDVKKDKKKKVAKDSRNAAPPPLNP